MISKIMLIILINLMIPMINIIIKLYKDDPLYISYDR